jgi:hypothetical protein
MRIVARTRVLLTEKVDPQRRFFPMSQGFPAIPTVRSKNLAEAFNHIMPVCGKKKEDTNESHS